MALYFQHGNYQISNAWKFSYFHGSLRARSLRLSARSRGRLLQSPEVQGTKKQPVQAVGGQGQDHVVT